jgi:hypothetical protein
MKTWFICRAKDSESFNETFCDLGDKKQEAFPGGRSLYAL